MIVLFGDRIFCGKPEILLCGKRIIKACFCKACDRFVCIVHTLDHARTFKIVDQLYLLATILCSKDKLCFSCARYFDFGIFINITVSMSCQCDRLFPVSDTWLDAFYYDRCTENSSVKCCTDRSVRALPHFLQIIFCHTSSIRCDRCAFDSNAIFLCGKCGFHCYFIICCITVFQTKIVILCFQINIRKQ